MIQKVDKTEEPKGKKGAIKKANTSAPKKKAAATEAKKNKTAKGKKKQLDSDDEY